jgi:hypothetical protein
MKRIWYIEIEGVGDYISGGSRLYRWCTRVPTGAAHPGRYVAGTSTPSAIGSSVDFGRGTTSFGALNLKSTKSTTVRAIFDRTFHRAQTNVANTAATASATTIEVTSTTGIVVTDIVYLNREAMEVTGLLAAPSRLQVNRAELGTAAQGHPIGTEVFLTNPIMYNRRASLFTIDDEETTITEVWAGRFEDIPENANLAEITLLLASDMALLKGYIGQGRQSYRVMGPDYPFYHVFPRDEDASLLTTMVTRATGVAPAIDEPAAVVEYGDQIIPCKEVGHDGQIATATPYNPNADSQAYDMATSLQSFEVLTSREGYNIFYRYDLDSSTYEVTNNPIHIALILILSTGDENNYQVGDSYRYDTLPRGAGTFEENPGLGIPRSRIDLDTWELYADQIAKDWGTDDVIIGLERADVVLNKLLWPMGIIISEGSANTLTLIRLTDTAPGDTRAIAITEQDTIFGSVKPSRKVNQVFDVARIQFADAKEDTVVLESTLRWFLGAGSFTYEVDASYYDVEADYYRVRAYAEQFARRMRFPPPKFRMKVRRSIGEQVYPGSLVLLSHPVLSTSLGTKGLSSAGCYVLEKTQFFDEADTCEIVVLYTTHDILRSGLIFWALEVAWYDVSKKRAYIHERYSADGDDVAPVALSQRVALRDADWNVRNTFSAQTVKIAALDSASPFSYIELDAHFEDATNTDIYPKPGDIITGVRYDNTNLDETDTYHYLADSAGTVGAAGDDGYEYLGGD